MKALRFVLVTVAATLASLVLAVPAGAIDNTAKVPNPIITQLPPPLFQCPRDGSITLSKTADKTDYNLNDIVTFTLKAHANVCDLEQVMVHDTLPAGLLVSNPLILDHSFGKIAAGTDKSFTFQAVAVAKGMLTNKAHATGFSYGLDDPGKCKSVQGPVPVLCPTSADAQVTVKVTAPSPTPPPTPTPSPAPTQPTPTPTQPPSNPGPTPSLPNTGHQG